MANIAVDDPGITRQLPSARLAALSRLKLVDAGFAGLTRAAAFTVLVLLGGVIVSLVDGALPALKAFGFGFLTTQTWNPVNDVYGAAAPIYGTIVTSLVAMAIAVPVGLGVAIFLTELCPFPLRGPIGMAIELLAGIPSIISASGAC